MRRFTVRDFIDYNAPCFSCRSKINFNIGFLDLETANISYLRPTVRPSQTEIDLVITYSDALKLCIDHKTNQISTNNKENLVKYLNSHWLFLSSVCDRCLTQIESRYLDFDLKRNAIKAVGLSSEKLIVMDNHNLYRINSTFMSDHSYLTIDSIDRTRPLSPINLELPLLPKYRFKNRAHFLRKMKLYTIFS